MTILELKQESKLISAYHFGAYSGESSQVCVGFMLLTLLSSMQCFVYCRLSGFV